VRLAVLSPVLAEADARPRRFRSDVDDVGAVGDKLVGLRECGIERLKASAVGKGVRRQFKMPMMTGFTPTDLKKASRRSSIADLEDTWNRHCEERSDEAIQ
jgi:hypothetical protein